jgi:ABC-type polysaccharide/polyol phosphate transport system ATPase subunit
MPYVRTKNLDVQIPVFDVHSLRLLRLPSLGSARVGTGAVTQKASTIFMHALVDLNLDLADGDRVCLIGHNGAGKTTLLRLVAGIYPPARGSMSIDGKVFALLGTGMALNSDATGYENMKMVANLYDWPVARLGALMKDIEEFTELGEYLSLPTRTYSAGMQARLAFAMATAQSPDILLIDEAIGAGDAEFQEKAQDRVKQFIDRAKIILLASHSVALCRAICTKGLVLEKGRSEFFGGIDEAYECYGLLR